MSSWQQNPTISVTSLSEEAQRAFADRRDVSFQQAASGFDVSFQAWVEITDDGGSTAPTEYYYQLAGWTTVVVVDSDGKLSIRPPKLLRKAVTTGGTYEVGGLYYLANPERTSKVERIELTMDGACIVYNDAGGSTTYVSHYIKSVEE